MNMEEVEFRRIEKYMLKYMNDSAHDSQHIYRVLTNAMKIARNYDVDKSVLISSCLLHDIGRFKQLENPLLCHAFIGAQMAFDFLVSLKWSISTATHVKDCILTHRFRSNKPPESIEAKILFDSDRLDVTGALGIARTILFKGQVGEPIYSVDEENIIHSGEESHPESFLKEYNQKLSKIYNLFYTEEAKELAESRQKISRDFYENILSEIDNNFAIYCFD